MEHIHTTIYKTDEQQGPTYCIAQGRTILSILY